MEERKREREVGSGSPPPVIVSALILDQFTGYIRVYASSSSSSSSSETRHQLCCTDTRERERDFIETRVDSDGFEYVAKRGTTSINSKNSL